MSQSHSNWTTREQKEVLIKLMEDNQEIARGFSTNRTDVDRFWRNAAEKLNSCGPPTKDGATWKKVWADFKTKTKKKLVENEVKRKQSGFNDNNLTILTDFEEAIVRLTALSEAVKGIRASVFGIAQPPTEESETLPNDVSMTSCNETENVHEDLSPRCSRRPKKDTPVQILQKQNDVQQVFFEDLCSKLNKIQEELHRMSRYLQRTSDMQKENFEENRRHHLALEDLLRQKLELKKKLLHVQLDQIKARLDTSTSQDD